MIRAARAILAKDLRLELRTKESVPAMVLFTLTVYVLFHFGLDRDTLDGLARLGVLWVTLLLAAVVGVARLFATEREQGGVDGLRPAPVDPRRCSSPRPPRCSSSSAPSRWWRCPRSRCSCSGLTCSTRCRAAARPPSANLGLAAAGALVAALATATRTPDLIVPLLLLLLVPALIAAAEASEPLLRDDPVADRPRPLAGIPHALRCRVRASLRGRLRLPARGLMYSKGFRPLAIATVVALATSLSLVFFYAPIDADQGFVQKIFYVHVPMAIVAMGGWIAGALMAIKHLRSGDSSGTSAPTWPSTCRSSSAWECW